MKDFIWLGGYDISIHKTINQEISHLKTITLNSNNRKIKTMIKPKTGNYGFTSEGVHFSKPYAYSLEIENLYPDFPIIIVETWKALESLNYQNTYSFNFATNFPNSGTYNVQSPLISYTSSLWANGTFYSSSSAGTIENGKIYYSFTFFSIGIDTYNGNQRAIISPFGEYCILKGDPTPFINPDQLSNTSVNATDYTSYKNYTVNARMNNICHVNKEIYNIDVYIGINPLGELQSRYQSSNPAYYFNKFYLTESSLYIPGELVENSNNTITKFTNTGNLMIKNDFIENAETAAYQNYFESWRLIEY